MTTIVDRLRDPLIMEGDGPWKLRLLAAAEIERLRLALTDITGVGGVPETMIRIASDALRK